jgi:hypothetical protein
MATITRKQYNDLYGPTVGDKIRLANSSLIVEIERDLRATYGDEIAVAVLDNRPAGEFNCVVAVARKYGVEVDAFGVEHTGDMFPIASASSATRQEVHNGKPSVVFRIHSLFEFGGVMSPK